MYKGCDAMKKPNAFCIVYCSQHADSTALAETPMGDGGRYFPLNHIIPPAAEDMIDHIREESDDNDIMQCPNP
jgi:hypothetical protein